MGEGAICGDRMDRRRGSLARRCVRQWRSAPTDATRVCCAATSRGASDAPRNLSAPTFCSCADASFLVVANIMRRGCARLGRRRADGSAPSLAATHAGADSSERFYFRGPRGGSPPHTGAARRPDGRTKAIICQLTKIADSGYVPPRQADDQMVETGGAFGPIWICIAAALALLLLNFAHLASIPMPFRAAISALAAGRSDTSKSGSMWISTFSAPMAPARGRPMPRSFIIAGPNVSDPHCCWSHFACANISSTSQQKLACSPSPAPKPTSNLVLANCSSSFAIRSACGRITARRGVSSLISVVSDVVARSSASANLFSVEDCKSLCAPAARRPKWISAYTPSCELSGGCPFGPDRER